MLDKSLCQGQDLTFSHFLSFQLDALSLNYLLTLYLKLPKTSVRYVRERKEQGPQLENLSIIKDALSIEVSPVKSFIINI